MGIGGILWIWMTIILSVVHLNPLIFDFDHLKEKSPELFQKMDSERFIVPGLRTKITDRLFPRIFVDKIGLGPYLHMKIFQRYHPSGQTTLTYEYDIMNCSHKFSTFSTFNLGLFKIGPHSPENFFLASGEDCYKS